MTQRRTPEEIIDEALGDMGQVDPETIHPIVGSALDGLDPVGLEPASAEAHLKLENPGGYRGTTELANAFTLGLGPQIYAATRATKDSLRERSNPDLADEPFGKLWRKNYLTALSDFTAEREAYKAQNPVTTTTIDLAGALPATATALGAAGRIGPAIAARSGSAAPLVDLLSGTVRPGADWATRTATRILGGAASGAGAGALQSNFSNEPFWDQVRTGAEVGAVLGPAGGAVYDALRSNVPRSAALQARDLMDVGVPLQAGSLPGAGAAVSTAHQLFGDLTGEAERAALTRAANRGYGEFNEPVATQEVINRNAARIGAIYDRFNTVTVNKYQDSLDRILDHVADAHGGLIQDPAGATTGIPAENLNRLRSAVASIENAGAGGAMDGRTWRNLAKQLDPLLLDPYVGNYAMDIRDELNNMLERSVVDAGGRWVPAGAATAGAAPATGGTAAGSNYGRLAGPQLPVPFGQVGPRAPGSVPPAPPGMIWEVDPTTQEAVQMLRQANGEYKNLKLVSRAVDPTTGIVQPSKLAAQVAKFYPPSTRRPATPYEQYMQALAPAKQFIPNAAGGAGRSGFFQQVGHAVAHGIAPFAVPVGAEYFMEGAHGDPLHWAAALAGGYAAKQGLGVAARAVNSPAGARRLIRNALTGEAFDPTSLAIPPAVQLYNGDQQ